LAQSSLVSAIEAEFALRFKMSEMFQITSFQAARALLEEKGL
jgi:acyl carrier protein